MSRTATYPNYNGKQVLANSEEQLIQSHLWNEALDLSSLTSAKTTQLTSTDHEVVSSAIASTWCPYNLIDKKAGAVADTFYGLTHQLIQAKFGPWYTSIIPSSTNKKAVDLDLENDIWVEMPPLSQKKVKIKVRFTGQGKPLEELGPLAED